MAGDDYQGVGDDFKPQVAPPSDPNPLDEDLNYDSNERADERVRVEQPDGSEVPEPE